MKNFGNLAALLSLAMLASGAQSQAAKTAKSVEAKTDLNKIMSKDELRACMKLKEDIVETAAQLEQKKAALSADRVKLSASGSSETATTLRRELDAATAEYKAADAAVKDHGQVIERWNEEVKALDDSTMKSAERQKKKLLERRTELESKNKGLLDERDKKSKLYAAAVERFNEQATQSQSLTADWNKRNDALVNEGDKLIDMKMTYSADCGSRRFREDDESAIKAGK